MKKKRLIIIAGAKGGSGKSLAATILHSWLTRSGSKLVAYDGDRENATLSRFIPESIFIDMLKPSAIDDILSPLAKDEADTVLLDSQAASSEEMIQWLEKMGIDAIKTDLGTSVTIVVTVTHSQDTLEQLKSWTDQLSDSANWLIIRNLVGSQVDEYDNSRLRQRILKELGGAEMTIPKIEPFLIQIMEQTSSTISRASTDPKTEWTKKRRFQSLEKVLFQDLSKAQGVLKP